MSQWGVPGRFASGARQVSVVPLLDSEPFRAADGESRIADLIALESGMSPDELAALKQRYVGSRYTDWPR